MREALSTKLFGCWEWKILPQAMQACGLVCMEEDLHAGWPLNNI
jgi:hypothetical protein